MPSARRSVFMAAICARRLCERACETERRVYGVHRMFLALSSGPCFLRTSELDSQFVTIDVQAAEPIKQSAIPCEG